MFNDDNNSSGNNDNKGKFSDRLKKMRYDRLKLKKNKRFNDNDEEISFNTVFRNIFKVVLALPSVIYTNIFDNEKGKLELKKKNISNKELLEEEVKVNNLINEKIIKVNKIKDIDISILKKERKNFISKYNYDNVDKIDNIINIEVKKEKLQKEIVNLIKKKLVKSINELEILQSELYILSQMDFGDTYYEQCKYDIKEIKKLLSKVKSLKEKYDYLKDNIDFQDVLEYSDDILIDKIIELKQICSIEDIKIIVDDYKILEEFKFLYLKIDKLEEDTIKLEEYKNKKVYEFSERDINFDKLKKDIYDIDLENEKYNNFVNEQERILKEIDNGLLNVNVEEVVKYRLKGFSTLLGNSL